MQTHSGDKNFECNRCHKTFALKSYLNKHLESACLKDEGAVNLYMDYDSNPSSPASFNGGDKTTPTTPLHFNAGTLTGNGVQQAMQQHLVELKSSHGDVQLRPVPGGDHPVSSVSLMLAASATIQPTSAVYEN